MAVEHVLFGMMLCVLFAAGFAVLPVFLSTGVTAWRDLYRDVKNWYDTRGM